MFDDGARRLHAVHDRHLKIHEDEIERFAGVDGFDVRRKRPRAVAHNLRVESQRLQNLLRHFLVDEIILRHQHAHARLGVRVEIHQRETVRLRFRRREIHQRAAAFQLGQVRTGSADATDAIAGRGGAEGDAGSAVELGEATRGGGADDGVWGRRDARSTGRRRVVAAARPAAVGVGVRTVDVEMFVLPPQVRGFVGGVVFVGVRQVPNPPREVVMDERFRAQRHPGRQNARRREGHHHRRHRSNLRVALHHRV